MTLIEEEICRIYGNSNLSANQTGVENKISQLTYKVVAISEIIQGDVQDCVDWAIVMLQLGHETPNLLMLSATSKSASYFEVRPYLEDAIRELGLEMKSGNGAIISYACYYVCQISKSEDVRSNLKKLYEFCQQRDYEDLVYDFYLLHWAWDQIDHDDSNFNHYWEGANKNNIKKIVKEVAITWLFENKHHFRQNPLERN